MIRRQTVVSYAASAAPQGWRDAHTQLTVSVLHDATQEPRCLVTMVADLTEVHLLHGWLNHQTLPDLQTGLPNRQYFVSHLEEVLGCLEPSAVLTLLYLDLDGFSVINDGLGHRYGDQVLSMVARRLESVVADQQAIVARIGADEYAILIQPGNSIPEVSQLAETINTELAEAIYHDDIGVAVTARIGVVQRQAGGMEPGELMRAASATLRRLRGSGRQWALFDTDSDAADRAELRLAAGMPGALETGELQVQYRPVAALADGRLAGIEALLTWHHLELGRAVSRSVHAAHGTDWSRARGGVLPADYRRGPNPAMAAAEGRAATSDGYQPHSLSSSGPAPRGADQGSAAADRPATDCPRAGHAHSNDSPGPRRTRRRGRWGRRGQHTRPREPGRAHGAARLRWRHQRVGLPNRAAGARRTDQPVSSPAGG